MLSTSLKKVLHVAPQLVLQRATAAFNFFSPSLKTGQNYRTCSGVWGPAWHRQSSFRVFDSTTTTKLGGGRTPKSKPSNRLPMFRDYSPSPSLPSLPPQAEPAASEANE